jgi:hypothetical protein
LTARRYGHRPGHHGKYLRRTTRGAAGSSFGATIDYLRRTTSFAAGYGLGITSEYLRGAASISLGITTK